VLAASGNTAKNGRNLETVEEKAPNCVDQRVAFPWLSLGLDEVAGRGSTSGLRSYLTAEVDLGKPLKVLRERFDAIEPEEARIHCFWQYWPRKLPCLHKIILVESRR
jgi:hypothetical protein